MERGLDLNVWNTHTSALLRFTLCEVYTSFLFTGILCVVCAPHWVYIS